MTNADFIKEAQSWAKAQQLPDPWERFVDNVETAERRGIAWMLSFKEWWTLWKPYYHERGPRRGQKVLCRYLDQGDYRIDNVRVDLGVNNGVEKGVANRMKSQTRSARGPTHASCVLKNEYSAKRPLRPDEALEVSRGEAEPEEFV